MTKGTLKSTNSAEDDQIIAAFANVRKSIVAERQTISEDLFVGAFLPFFLNSPTADERISMKTWYGIAGGAFNEVNVVDRAGKVIFAVPPIMSNKLVAPISGNGGKALSSLMAHASRRDQLIPGTGSALLTEGLKRFEFVSPDAEEVMSGYQARWAEIVARYADVLNSSDGSKSINITGDEGLDIFEF